MQPINSHKSLIKKRKKEFGIYMTLGMGKSGMSKMLLIETILIGLISLAAGLLVGIFIEEFFSCIISFNKFVKDFSIFDE